jgi:hypothetical protein
MVKLIGHPDSTTTRTGRGRWRPVVRFCRLLLPRILGDLGPWEGDLYWRQIYLRLLDWKLVLKQCANKTPSLLCLWNATLLYCFIWNSTWNAMLLHCFIWNSTLNATLLYCLWDAILYSLSEIPLDDKFALVTMCSHVWVPTELHLSSFLDYSNALNASNCSL